jgi:hypothetical protein
MLTPNIDRIEISPHTSMWISSTTSRKTRLSRST